ncbi:MAG: hypothetical protein ACP5NZ_04645 [Nanobdellota archaeon]
MKDAKYTFSENDFAQLIARDDNNIFYARLCEEYLNLNAATPEELREAVLKKLGEKVRDSALKLSKYQGIMASIEDESDLEQGLKNASEIFPDLKDSKNKIKENKK